MWADDGSGWWMVLGMVMMVLFWGGVIALAVWLVQSLLQRDDHPSQPGGGQSALDVARMRYARGEITREEFQQLSADLSGR